MFCYRAGRETGELELKEWRTRWRSVGSLPASLSGRLVCAHGMLDKLGACKSNEWRRGRKCGGEDLCNPLETTVGRGRRL